MASPLSKTILVTGNCEVETTVVWHQLGRLYDKNYADEFERHYERHFKRLAEIPTFFRRDPGDQLRGILESEQKQDEEAGVEIESKERLHSLDQLRERKCAEPRTPQWLTEVGHVKRVWQSRDVREYYTSMSSISSVGMRCHPRLLVDDHDPEDVFFERMRVLEKLAFGGGRYTEDDLLRCWSRSCSSLPSRGIAERTIEVDGCQWNVVCRPDRCRTLQTNYREVRYGRYRMFDGVAHVVYVVSLADVVGDSPGFHPLYDSVEHFHYMYCSMKNTVFSVVYTGMDALWEVKKPYCLGWRMNKVGSLDNTLEGEDRLAYARSAFAKIPNWILPRDNKPFPERDDFGIPRNESCVQPDDPAIVDALLDVTNGVIGPDVAVMIMEYSRSRTDTVFDAYDPYDVRRVFSPIFKRIENYAQEDTKLRKQRLERELRRSRHSHPRFSPRLERGISAFKRMFVCSRSV